MALTELLTQIAYLVFLAESLIHIFAVNNKLKVTTTHHRKRRETAEASIKSAAMLVWVMMATDVISESLAFSSKARE